MINPDPIMAGIQWIAIVVFIGVMMFLAGQEWMDYEASKRNKERDDEAM